MTPRPRRVPLGLLAVVLLAIATAIGALASARHERRQAVERQVEVRERAETLMGATMRASVARLSDLATLMAVPGVDQAQFGRSTQALLDESAFGAVWFMRRTPADVARNRPERARLAFAATRVRGPPIGFDFAALPGYRRHARRDDGDRVGAGAETGPIPVGGWDAFVFMLPVVADPGPLAAQTAAQRRERTLGFVGGAFSTATIDAALSNLVPNDVPLSVTVGGRGAGRRRRRAASDGGQIPGRRARLVDRRRPPRPRPRRHLDDPRRRRDRDARARAADLDRRAARALRAGAGRRADGRARPRRGRAAHRRAAPAAAGRQLDRHDPRVRARRGRHLRLAGLARADGLRAGGAGRPPAARVRPRRGPRRRDRRARARHRAGRDDHRHEPHPPPGRPLHLDRGACASRRRPRDGQDARGSGDRPRRQRAGRRRGGPARERRADRAGRAALPHRLRGGADRDGAVRTSTAASCRSTTRSARSPATRARSSRR